MDFHVHYFVILGRFQTQPRLEDAIIPFIVVVLDSVSTHLFKNVKEMCVFTELN